MTAPLVDRLSEPQRRHLVECWTVEQERGECYWRPVGSGEGRTAVVLARLGLLRRDHGSYASPFVLTDSGRAVARALAAEASHSQARGPDRSGPLAVESLHEEAEEV